MAEKIKAAQSEGGEAYSGVKESTHFDCDQYNFKGTNKTRLAIHESTNHKDLTQSADLFPPTVYHCNECGFVAFTKRHLDIYISTVCGRRKKKEASLKEMGYGLMWDLSSFYIIYIIHE